MVCMLWGYGHGRAHSVYSTGSMHEGLAVRWPSVYDAMLCERSMAGGELPTQSRAVGITCVIVSGALEYYGKVHSTHGV